MAFSHIFCRLYVAILPEKWQSHDFQSRGNQEPFKTLKKNIRDQRLLYAMQKKMGDILRFYFGSYFFLTGNDLGFMGVFQKKV